MKKILTSFVLLFWLFNSTSFASSDLVSKIEVELKDSLFPISSLIPDYRNPGEDPPKVAIADFHTNNNDLTGWSQAFSEILRNRIQYIPGVRLYMPASYKIHIDAKLDTNISRPILVEQSAFQALNKTIGIEIVLTGSVQLVGNQYTLITELRDAVTGELFSSGEWTFTEPQTGATINGIASWVYSSLNIELSAEETAYLQDESTLSKEAIKDFLSVYADIIKLEKGAKRELIFSLQQKHPQFSLLAIYALLHRNRAEDLDESYKNLEFYKRLRELNPNHAGVALMSYRAMQVALMPNHEVSRHLDNMSRLIVENPHDAMIMLNYADLLVNNGDIVKGVSVLLQAVKRWPENYRIWWSLGWSLKEHAWQVRGDTNWKHVPKNAKIKFGTLSIFADQVIDKALLLNNRNGSLWNLKLNTLGSIDGYSKELIDVFDEAIKVAPNNWKIYNSALHFSTDKWGGYFQARRHIISMAEKNNPEATWVKSMRKNYRLDTNDLDGPLNFRDIKGEVIGIFDSLKNLIDSKVGGRYVVLFLIIILWLTYALGKRAGRREEKYNNEFMDETPGEYK